MKEINMGKSTEIPNEFEIKAVELGLDKLTLTVTPPNMSTYNDYVKHAKFWVITGDTACAAPPAARAGYHFALRIMIPGIPGDAFPLLQIAPYGKSAYFRLEFNPNRLGPVGIEHLKNIIDGNSPDGWALFMHHSRASRLDVNIDIQGIPISQFLVGTTYPRTTELWKPNGELKTIYLGQKQSSSKIYRVYGLADAKVSEGCTAATRFESVDEASRPKLMALHSYDCPFDKLIIRAVSTSRPAGWTEGHWRMFLKFGQDHGLTVAMQHLTAIERKQAKKALDAAAITALDFSECWSHWTPLISAFGLQTAGFLGSHMAGFAFGNNDTDVKIAA
jgi:hypothetical protein